MEPKTYKEMHQDYVMMYDGFLKKCKSDKNALLKQKNDCNENETHLVKLLESEIKALDKRVVQCERAIMYHGGQCG